MQMPKKWRGFPLRMRWVTIVALLLFIPTLIIAQQSPTAKAPAQTGAPADQATSPKAVFKEKRFAFGEIQRGEKIVHTFMVKNEGNGPLNISNVSPG